MDRSSSSQILLFLAVAAFLCMYGVFLQVSLLGASPFILFFASTFILYPFRRESIVVRRLLLLGCLTFAFWLVREIAALFVPFILAFALAYMLDPAIRFLARKRIPRVVSAAIFVLSFIGGIAAISIFVFPVIFSQLNDILRELTSLLTNAANYLESRSFFRLLSKYGLNSPETRELIQKEIVPRLEGSFGMVFRTMLSFLSSVSGIVSQLLNIILTPILMFYFLKDFDKLKRWIVRALGGKNDKLLSDLRRIHYIVQAYIGGQAIAVVVVTISASALFAAFGIPYPIVLGVVCGLLNPIPYIGMGASIATGCITVIIVGNNDAILTSIGVIVAVVGGLHLIDTYGIQPRIVGQRVGLHPLMLISSLFVFGHFFGITGLIVAVPAMAGLLMFVKDWIEKRAGQNPVEPSQTHVTQETIITETINETTITDITTKTVITSPTNNDAPPPDGSVS